MDEEDGGGHGVEIGVYGWNCGNQVQSFSSKHQKVFKNNERSHLNFEKVSKGNKCLIRVKAIELPISSYVCCWKFGIVIIQSMK